MVAGERSDGSVVGSWSMITEFLGRHCPPVAAQIRPPATAGWLRRAQAAVGDPLPEDLAQWWQLADGMDGPGALIPQLHTPLSIQDALDSRTAWMTASANLAQSAPEGYPSEECEHAVHAPAGTPCAMMWLPQWLPIAGDGGGTDLFVDLRPGPARGCVGEYDADEWEFTGPTWDNVTVMLTDIAEAIRTGKRVRGLRLWIDDEGISWDHDARRWAQGGSTEINPELLRQRYAELVQELRTGGFQTPPDGGWPAETIAAHVKRNTELLIAVTDKIAATTPEGGRPAAGVGAGYLQRAAHTPGRTSAPVGATVRYDNRDTLDPAILTSYAAAGLPALADDIEQLSERLLHSAHQLRGRRPSAHAHIADDGPHGTIIVIDDIVGWWGVLWALGLRQLPRRARQLRRLRPAS